MPPFVFTSPKLPSIKAKQLQKNFPFLKLSQAQEATARALGYASWYECTKRGTQGTPSMSDQAAGMPTRVIRYYYQACVLMALGITPADADQWVRAWGLTGSPTFAPSKALPLYYEWLDSAQRIERGELNAQEIEQTWGEAGWSKHPDIDRPVRISEGVLLAPCGKYPHYAVDPAILARTPIYLRGTASLFHFEDDGDLLVMMVPGCKPEYVTDRPRFNHLQHEWHYGTKHPDARALLAPQLISAALAVPDEMVVISARAMPLPDGEITFESFAVACLRGADFAEFIRNKGVLDPTKVVWYRDLDEVPTPHMMWHWLDGGWDKDELHLPVFKSARQHRLCLPIYSYPFKEAPMASDEFSTGHERLMLLPLDQDFAEDETDDEGDDDGPYVPDPSRPLSPTAKALIDGMEELRHQIARDKGHPA
jgi:hypothetical protein